MERYRIAPDAAVYFVTYSVVDWLPVFVTGTACETITNSLNFCHNSKSLRINAYVVMPTHFHAIVFDKDYDAARLEAALTDFRKFTGRALCDYCSEHMPLAFTDTFKLASGEDRQRRFWQPSRHPVVIESEPFWQRKFDYLHENPVRKCLVVRAADWRFSSASYYYSDGRSPSEVKLSPIIW
jgi:hypothetical protein